MFQTKKGLILQNFNRQGFRVVSEADPDNKHYIIDECDIQIGDVYEVGPNGYFELKGRRNDEGVIVNDLES
jgi:hypothetical protein